MWYYMCKFRGIALREVKIKGEFFPIDIPQCCDAIYTDSLACFYIYSISSKSNLYTHNRKTLTFIPNHLYILYFFSFSFLSHRCRILYVPDRVQYSSPGRQCRPRYLTWTAFLITSLFSLYRKVQSQRGAETFSFSVFLLFLPTPSLQIFTIIFIYLSFFFCNTSTGGVHVMPDIFFFFFFLLFGCVQMAGGGDTRSVV